MKGILYRKFQEGGSIVKTVGHERGKPVTANVRVTDPNRGTLDVVQQGVTDSNLVNNNFAQVGEQLYYNMDAMPRGTRFINGVPQTNRAGRYIPSPTGVNPAAVPNDFGNRFSVGKVLGGVQSFDFGDQQFRGKYSRNQIDQLFLNKFWRANPYMKDVLIDGNRYSRR